LLSKDPYITAAFQQEANAGIFVDVRHVKDLQLLAGAIKYADIIKAKDLLNVSVCYEHTKSKKMVRKELNQIVDQISASPFYGHLSFEAATGYYYD
jgi:hypothetical protein